MHRYNEKAQEFDSSLSEMLIEHALESAATKKADYDADDDFYEADSLDRLRETPLDEVKKIIESKKRPGAAVLKEHRVRAAMHKAAALRESTVEEFLTMARR